MLHWPAMRIGRKAVTTASKTSSADLNAKGKRFAIVVARFNAAITERLLAGAIDALRRQGAAAEKITHVWVPGSFEIPAAAMQMAKSGRYAAVICLGCLIRGETAHFDYIAQTAAHGISRVSLDTGVPCTFGVLTTENEQQAVARAGDADNKGAEAALAAIEMANVFAKLKAERG